jgi:O-antigen ligase
MSVSQPVLQRAACYLSFGSAISILFSIAISQILLALALAAVLLSGTRLRLPPVWPPAALFLLGTIISLILSSDPGAGFVQVRKFYVWLTLLALFSTVRELPFVRKLFLCWATLGAGSAVWGLVQFARKYNQARALGVKFYDYYTGERITGAMSHWMTFGGEAMFVLLMLGAYVLFGPERRLRSLWPWLGSALLIAAALVLGQTRSIWLGTLAGGVYLIWFWNRRVMLILPVALAALVFLGPISVRERFTSMFRPRKDIDSNEFRLVTWRTGLRMIETHPWFGLGPEEPRLQFNNYVPPDVPRPLPVGSYIHLHNVYLHYAAERGIPAMLALVWLLIKLLMDFSRAVRKLPPGPGDRRFVLHGAVAIVIATMVVGCFELNLGDSEVLTMFLVAVACGYVAAADAPPAESVVA